MMHGELEGEGSWWEEGWSEERRGVWVKVARGS